MRSSCEAISTALPPPRARSHSSAVASAPAALSSDEVGSSAKMIAGRLAIARAIPTRCCSPPESSRGNRSVLPASPSASSVASARARASRGATPRAQHQLDVLPRAQRRDQVEALEDEADGVEPQPRARGAVEPGEIGAGQRDGAARGAQQPRQHREQRRLARAGVTAQQDDLAGRDVERRAAQHVVAARALRVAVVQPAPRDDRRRRGRERRVSHRAPARDRRGSRAAPPPAPRRRR